MADKVVAASGEPESLWADGLANVYECAGLRLRSPLPLAARVVEGPADVVVVRGADRPVPHERPSDEVIAERVVDGNAWYTFARRGEGVVGRFYGLVDFEIDGAGQRVTYHRESDGPDYVALLIVGSLVAYLLSAAGRLVLHASAVEVDATAVGFVGFSGQGKTTVAALLCAEGYPLVTDDLLPVDSGPEGVTCAPAGIELRVREKVETLLERFSSGVVRGRTLDNRHAVAPSQQTQNACGLPPWSSRGRTGRRRASVPTDCSPGRPPCSSPDANGSRAGPLPANFVPSSIP